MTSTRLKIAKFLGTKLYEGKYILIDYWMVIHFISGLLLMSIFMSLTDVFFILLYWELAEILISKFNPKLIKSESRKDIMNDLAFGMLGAIIYIL